MEIKEIQVKNLFGYFNHKIELKSDGITIIYGENGLGKTVMLEMISAFFKFNYSYFSNLEYEFMKITLQDDSFWILSSNGSYMNLKKYINDTNIINEYKIYLDYKKLYDVLCKIVKSYPYVYNVSSDKIDFNNIDTYRWLDTSVDKPLSYIDVIKNYNNLDNLSLDEIEFIKLYKNLIKEFESANVNLISTQRLLCINKERGMIRSTKMVERYSLELKNKIRKKLTESSELSAKLDSQYPQKLVNALKEKKKDSISYIEIENNLKELNYRRECLANVGLMEPGKSNNIDININDLKESNTVKIVMDQYIKDSKEKLNIFNDISKKIDTLMNIINSRFKHKKLYINKERGFEFRSTIIKDINGNYKFVPVSKLSSGEQNELVLFYELIFKSNKNSLILIDEPEISLHISWQNSFIKDLKEISEINNFEVIMATHSPNIIGNYWDNTVKLKGVE